MAQTSMAGSGPNAQVQAKAKANNNSAVKDQLQSNNQNAAGNATINPRYSSSAPMDMASVAPPSSEGATDGTVSNGNGSAALNGSDNSSLKHDSGLALEWSAEEQSILEEALIK